MVPMANGLGLSGQAFVGADVGGFFGDSSGELFLRWLQAGVLTPFCRNHTMMGTVDQYAWAWGGAVLDEGLFDQHAIGVVVENAAESIDQAIVTMRGVGV